MIGSNLQKHAHLPATIESNAPVLASPSTLYKYWYNIELDKKKPTRATKKNSLLSWNREYL